VKNATHIAGDYFGIGQPMIISPLNEERFPNGSSVMVKGFISAGGWDIVPCDSVRIYGSDSNNNIIIDKTKGLIASGDCGSGLPNFCFSENFVCPNDTTVTLTFTPLSSTSGQCGNSSQRTVKCGLAQ